MCVCVIYQFWNACKQKVQEKKIKIKKKSENGKKYFTIENYSKKFYTIKKRFAIRVNILISLKCETTKKNS